MDTSSELFIQVKTSTNRFAAGTSLPGTSSGEYIAPRLFINNVRIFEDRKNESGKGYLTDSATLDKKSPSYSNGSLSMWVDSTVYVQSRKTVPNSSNSERNTSTHLRHRIACT
jgi:hypothetical protein